jgi:hypothetical protein
VPAAARRPGGHRLEALRFTAASDDDQRQFGEQRTEPSRRCCFEAIDRFILAAREGKVVTKHGQRYKRTAIEDLDSALTLHVKPARRRDAACRCAPR